MNNDKPLSEWTLAESKTYCEEFRKSVVDSGVCEETPGCILREKGICKAANTWPHLWDLNRLSEQELAICNAVGAKWVSRDTTLRSNLVTLWEHEPAVRSKEGNFGGTFIAEVHKKCFPSVRPGDLIEVL